MEEEINQWLAFIDMERGDLLEMAKEKNKEIKEATDAYKVLTGDEEIKRIAEIRLMSELEEHSALATARAKGTEEGLRQGKEEGLKRGKEEGLKQGKEEGLKQGKEEIIKKMLHKGLNIDKIIELTGLSTEEIKKIVDKQNKKRPSVLRMDKNWHLQFYVKYVIIFIYYIYGGKTI